MSCVCKTVHYCNKECQKKDWKLHKKNCPPFAIGDAVGVKGRGMFATRNIAKASVILIEEPILTIETDFNDNSKQEKLFEKFLKLPESQRLEILKLCDRTETGETRKGKNNVGLVERFCG